MMCFSVNVNLIKEKIEERYGITFPSLYRYEPSYYYHAFSLPELPAICRGNPPEGRVLKWGLIPSWVRDENDAAGIRMKTFNARAETIDSKPSFSESFRTKRCIIPVMGFYEWQHRGKEKIPWYIFSPENQIISLAGLFSEWTSSATGETIGTFSIITTPANQMMSEIHNSKKRMPAVLGIEDERKWIEPSLSAVEVLKLLRPSPEKALEAHTISPLVNNRRVNRNTPEVIKPYNYSTNTLFG
jgi:putative SOS response-associated peptidase YedK